MGRVRDAVRETSASLSTVFRNLDLRRINLAFAGSLIGDWAYATAVAVWAYGVGGATAVGVFGVVRLTMLSLATPLASMLADRYPRKLVMIGSDLVRAVIVLGAAALVQWDAPAWTVFTLATLAAIAGAPFRPALSAWLPSLVKTPTELTAANGTGSTLESLAFFLGPASGGLLLAIADVPAVFVFNALTFVWSVALVAGVRAPTSTQVEAEPDADEGSGSDSRSGFMAELTEGFRSIWANTDLRTVVGIYCAQAIVAGASLVFVVSVAVDLVDLGPQGVGYLDAVLGVGAILGGFFAIGRASHQRLASDFGVGVLLWALPLLLVAAWPELFAAFAAMFVIGAANPVVDVNAATIIQRLTPDAVMGRVFGALETVLIAAMALGALLMPLLIASIGLRWGLTVIALLVVLLVLPGMRRLRGLDETLREPDGLALLRQVPLFAPLALPALDRLARQLVRVEAPAGTVIIREGDGGDRFYIVESGRVEASYNGMTLSFAGPGEPFGEIALLRNVPRTATVTTVEDTVLQAVDRADFLAVLTGNDEARNRADELVSRRIPTT
jgi:MFS family permease